jgi:16S rRNA (guanine(1405)-N(7))-methyltransferase
MQDRGPASQIEEIVASVHASRKYRHICPTTVRRIATSEWAKRRSIKAAIKATKSRLHQVYGAYENDVDYDRAWSMLSKAYADNRPERVRSACEGLLALHTSTRERIPILDQFYASVFALTGVPQSVLDLACGMNPLSLPWMGLDQGAFYCAYDIDCERIAFLRRYLDLTRLVGCARCQDVISTPPLERADLALLLKSSPCLERQGRGSTLALLDALQVRHIVVSFPIKSLGQREKGMVEHYDRFFAEIVSDRRWGAQRLNLSNEMVFVVDKG